MKLFRGVLEAMVVGALGGMIVAVQALELPVELSWLSGALLLALGALKALAGKIDGEAN